MKKKKLEIKDVLFIAIIIVPFLLLMILGK